jgi:glucose-6-phosphate isomerase
VKDKYKYKKYYYKLLTNKMIKQIVKNSPKDTELAAYLTKIEQAKNWLAEQVRNNQIAPLNTAFKSNDLDEFAAIAKAATKFERVVILGVGGSSLGGKTLTAIAKNSPVKIDFIESIDSNTIAKKLKEINLKKVFL